MTEREELTLLIAGGSRNYTDGSLIMDGHWKDMEDGADRILAAGFGRHIVDDAMVDRAISHWPIYDLSPEFRSDMRAALEIALNPEPKP